MNATAPQPEPLSVLFVQTSMPVGGAETLLVNLVERLDRRRFKPEVVCLKRPGPLGERLAESGVPVHSRLLGSKYDLRVLPRLVRLMRRRKIDAVVTVGAGDKMFWGRLAARLAGVPVVASALHSTGWPDGVGRLNRLLTPLTDAFIAVAAPHRDHLIEGERFPEEKVQLIPNGVDTDRFVPAPQSGAVREELGLDPTTPLVSILAALRPEKNHPLFLAMAQRVAERTPDARFLIIGDGPERPRLEGLAAEFGLFDPRRRDDSIVRFLGSRSDVSALMAATDVLALTSHNEAYPVSILEAMSCATPVVATDVGSVGEAVVEGQTGYLVPPGDERRLTERVAALLDDPLLRDRLGSAARQRVVQTASLRVMVEGYQRLIARLHAEKTGSGAPVAGDRRAPDATRTERLGVS